MSGPNWTCSSNTCRRSDPLNGGSSYPPVTVTVNVALNATSPQVNSVSVWGGGSAGASSADSTAITGAPPTVISHALNRDANADVIVYNPITGDEYTGLGDGAGAFSFGHAFYSPGFDTIRVGDWTGDGSADIIVYNSTNAAAYIGKNDGSGRFTFNSLFWSPG